MNWYKPVGECHAGDRDAELVGYGEVRQAEPARRMLLREEDLALAAVRGTPLPHAPLQGSQHRLAEALRIAALQFLEHAHRHQRRRALEHGHHFAVPHVGQRI